MGPIYSKAAKRMERYHAAARLSSCHLGAECGACAVVMARACRHERAMRHGLPDTSPWKEPGVLGAGQGSSRQRILVGL